MAEKDELLSHNYDGIQEYDNDLPRWWIALFWLTIGYGVFYAWYLHMGPGLDQHETLAKEMQEIAEQRAKVEQAQPKPADTGLHLAALLKDAAAIAKGKSVYDAKCMACHAAQGQGLVGPNLTDDYWIHGGEARGYSPHYCRWCCRQGNARVERSNL